jgi:iron complex outermembrane receptor protein
MRYSLLLTFLIVAFFYQPAFSQISGKVLDKQTSNPLAGAHVIAENEKTITDDQGRFELKEPTSKMVVSFVGYLPDTIFLSNERNEITVLLTPEAQNIEPVIIRGNLNEFPVMQMPSSISYIGNLEKQNLNTISYADHLNSIPGIYAQTGSLNTNRITIRGIGSRTPYGTNRIKAYYNEIPLTTGDGTTEIEDIDPALIGSVEVLKGSKSALYGSGLGGVIVLNKPTMKNGLHGHAGFTAGSYETMEYTAGFQYLKKGFYASGNFANSHSDGWRENSDYKRQNFQLNTGIVNAKSQLDFTLLAISTRAQIASSLNEHDFENSPQNAAPNWLEVKGFEEYSKYIAGLKFRHRFSEKVANSTNLFFQRYDGYESRPFNILDDEAFSWGIRNITTVQFSGLKIQAGFESMLENYSWRIYETLQGEQGNLLNQFSETRTPLSIFLNGQYQFSDIAVIEAGISLNTLNYSLDDESEDPVDLSGEYSYDLVFSPFIGFNVGLTEGMRLYGSVSHGFSAPSVEETLLPEGSINPDLKPETGINAETGLRFESRDKRIFIDAGIYSLWAQNLLVTKRETEDIFYGANAGKTRHTGLEVSSRFQLSGDESKYPASLDINYNYIKATFTHFTDDGVDFSGNTLPGIPQQNLWISANIESFLGFYLIPQFQFTGKQYLNDANDGSYEAFQLLHLKAGYQKMFGVISADISFGVRNLLDEHYASMILVNAPSFGGNLPRYYYPGMPRNYFLGLRISF